MPVRNDLVVKNTSFSLKKKENHGLKPNQTVSNGPVRSGFRLVNGLVRFGEISDRTVRFGLHRLWFGTGPDREQP